MALRFRRGGGNGLDAWPGYVDALSTLLMVTIFVLLVFVLAEAFLSAALTGSDRTITNLRAQIAQLSDALDLEKSNSASLTRELAALNASLAAAEAGNAALSAKLASANDAAAGVAAAEQSMKARQGQLEAQLSDAQAAAQAAAGRIAALQGAGGADTVSALARTKQQLQAQTQAAGAASAEVALLNQQVAALRLQLAAIAEALDAAQKADAKDKVQITNLGSQLNEALARRVEELQQYRSEFFGTLRQALAGQKNIRVVGDRFVFESDVLFPVDQATLTPEGKAQIADVAAAINQIAAKIPDNVNWVLSVDGYADAQKITGGPYTSNFDLSAARALSVLHLLIADGVPANRLVAAGFGDSHPIAPGNAKADYAQNRRIEFRLTNAD